MENQRIVTRILKGHETSDGAGVKLRRYIGMRDFSQHDPFLLLDIFSSDDPNHYVAGFPNHPHRGFETVTYLIQGKMEHNDSRGNKGVLEHGGAQFMRAGSGIIHSEMPRQENGMLWGYQLWVNLPKAEKMSDPHYQDLQASDIPKLETADYTAKVLSGKLNGTVGNARGFYPIDYFDIEIKSGKSATIPVATEKAAMVVVVSGNGKILDQEIVPGDLVILGEGDNVVFTQSNALRVLVVAGSPIGEPVARYGPFVMNTHKEIEQTLLDYESGSFA